MHTLIRILSVAKKILGVIIHTVALLILAWFMWILFKDAFRPV